LENVLPALINPKNALNRRFGKHGFKPGTVVVVVGSYNTRRLLEVVIHRCLHARIVERGFDIVEQPGECQHGKGTECRYGNEQTQGNFVRSVHWQLPASETSGVFLSIIGILTVRMITERRFFTAR
jgi:hypothetical protein